MSGLLALLDDVTVIAKMAAAQIDDVAATSIKVSTKTAGILIDDAAVAPKYVTGLAPARELPIIGRIALGSLRNKLLLLLPALLLLQAFLPWVITPLLMCGGAYLCFEGAEKLLHAFGPHVEAKPGAAAPEAVKDAAALEAERISGAIRTDLILSAEIMTIALSLIEADSLWGSAAILAFVAVMITVLVYGAVAVLVKMDDIGLHMAQNGPMRALGRGIVNGMPKVFSFLTVLGTAAMLWVGGNILVHGLDVLGWHGPYGLIHSWAEAAAALLPAAGGFVAWAVTAAADGVIGLCIGLVLALLITRVLRPALAPTR